ncbi:alpha/beta hydrolase [Lacticaseibacillus sp. GG6-2]
MRRMVCGFLLVLGLVLAPASIVHAATPAPVTVYLHGHHGSQRSMLPLIRAAQRQVGATPALVATVSARGQVHFSGHLTAMTPRPLVQVVFQNADTVDYHRLCRWLHNVMVGLATRYHVQRVNIVAHSLGNTAVEWYLLGWGNDPHLPRVVKWVSIAGNFDGIPRMHMQPRHNHIQPDGRPRLMAPEFRQAMLIRRRFPAVAILNLYGDVDDTHSDGRILNASTRALGFLVAGRAASYREQRITGPDASHSALRFNPRVIKATNDFLWH